jgi:membrane protease YdiL (CAAX protease family)
MRPKIRKSFKIIILLSIIWLAIAIPIPFLWIYPSLWHSEEYKTYVIIAVLLSIPLAIRGIIWNKKSDAID